jgi:uncharacterized protein YkwD
MVLKWLSAATLCFLLVTSGYADEAQVKPIAADPAIQEFVQLVNAKRRSMGCPELIWDDRVAAIASAHSADMDSRNFFSHTNPEGRDPFDRLQMTNVAFFAAAENIAFGPKTGHEVYETWLDSPGHRRNMLDCRFTRHGVGRVGDRWTHVLFRP